MTMQAEHTTGTSHEGLQAWVDEVAALTTPDEVVWVDGSDEEWDRLTSLLVESGTFTRLNPDKKPNSFHAASDPSDVARVEDRTFICSEKEEDAGFTNNWMAPAEMKATMTDLYRGSMPGRTMYVIPFVMGHLDADVPMFGVEITDSAYVVVSMQIMARIGTDVLAAIEASTDASFVPGLHSVGLPADRRPRRTCRGRAATPSRSPTSPRRARSGPSAPATAATPCWARSATPCASPRRWPATRAGWPSTCSSSS